MDGEQVVNAADGRGGTLHLKIVDPCPVPATLGPRLRDWLDHHLVFDLERQFRCLHPIRLFPAWLAEAGLYADGSTITKMTFLASTTTSLERSRPRMSTKNDRSEDTEQTTIRNIKQGGVQEEQPYEKDITQELQTMVGRLLWKEIWGPYVHLKGGKWWWEDNDILDECCLRRTLWEYAMIEAIKEQ